MTMYNGTLLPTSIYEYTSGIDGELVIINNQFFDIMMLCIAMLLALQTVILITRGGRK